jgi:hypothetical protein
MGSSSVDITTGELSVFLHDHVLRDDAELVLS